MSRPPGSLVPLDARLYRPATFVVRPEAPSSNNGGRLQEAVPVPSIIFLEALEPLELHPDRLFDSDPAIRSVARELYESVSDLPLVCPHGHVPPELLALDEPFPDPARLLALHLESLAQPPFGCDRRKALRVRARKQLAQRRHLQIACRFVGA